MATHPIVLPSEVVLIRDVRIVEFEFDARPLLVGKWLPDERLSKGFFDRVLSVMEVVKALGGVWPAKIELDADDVAVGVDGGVAMAATAAKG